MTIEPAPTPDEIAAIVTAIEAARPNADATQIPPIPRWRAAAREYASTWR